LELNEFSERWRGKDLYYSLLIAAEIVEQNCPLLNQVTFLIDNVLNKLAVRIWEWVSPLRSEDVCAITLCIIGDFLFGLVLKPHSIELSFMLDMTLVLLETNSKSLVEILSCVLILEQNLTSLSESRDLQR
jgi:hypothetical protein